MINDSHVHLGKSSGINQSLSITDLMKFRQDFPYVNKVLVMGTDLDHRAINDVLPKLCSENEWLYGLCWITNIHDTQIDIKGKIIGCKFHGAYMNMPVTHLSPFLLEKLENKILLVHCGRYLEGDIKSNTSYLHALEVARKYPKIKVILAHMGGTDTTVCKKAIDHAAGLYNVYFDTSGITTPYIIEYAIEQISVNRILFGSDTPWCSFNAMRWTVEDAMILRTEKDYIFHDNFEVLLK